MKNIGRPRKPQEILHVIGPSISYIPLTRGLFACINSNDAEKVSHVRWYAGFDKKGNRFYAISTICSERKLTRLSMHRCILHTDVFVDHISGETLDNRLQNLREATNAQNQANSKVKANSQSGYKGVWLNKKTGKYNAYVTIGGKTHYAGCGFTDASSAAVARLELAKKLHGEFAR